MAALENPKHEAFAQAVAEGASAAEAYRRAYKASVPTAETNGPKLLRDNAQVELRAVELKAIQSEIIEKQFRMSREDVIQGLVEVWKTPIGEIKESHQLCQEYSFTPGMHGDAYKYKMPSKLDALEKLIKMAGWYAPEKVEVSGGIAGLFAEITGAKQP